MIKVVKEFNNIYSFEKMVNIWVEKGYKVISTNIYREPDPTIIAIPQPDRTVYEAILADGKGDTLVSNSDPIIWTEEEKEKFLKILKEIIRGL